LRVAVPEEAAGRFDAETRQWADNVLSRGSFEHPFPRSDPEAMHDVLRLRGLLPLLADLCREPHETQVRERLEAVLSHAAALCDRHSAAGWDTTTTALRLLSILRANETMASRGRTLLSAELTNFIVAHQPVLAFGRYAEPAGNHRALNAFGRAAAKLLLRPRDPLDRESVLHLNELLDGQFLRDGGHIERCPHYHAQVLCTAAFLSAVDQRRGGQLASRLDATLSGAKQALHAMVTQRGEPARFGDNSRTFSGLCAAAELPIPPEVRSAASRRSSTLPSFGIARRCWQETDLDFCLLIDFGPLGLENNSGHGHADSLAFTLSVNGLEIIGDPGTYLYADTEESRLFKLPQAHATISWPTRSPYRLDRFFRWSASPPAPHAEAVSPSEQSRLFDATLRWRKGRSDFQHRRRWIRIDRGIRIVDRVESTTEEGILLHFPLGPQVKVLQTRYGSRSLLARSQEVTLEVRSSVSGTAATGEGWYCPHYGARVQSDVVQWRAEPADSICIITEIRVQ
jgi:uncharacterized heparinase superfamily protein